MKSKLTRTRCAPSILSACLAVAAAHGAIAQTGGSTKVSGGPEPYIPPPANVNASGLWKRTNPDGSLFSFCTKISVIHSPKTTDIRSDMQFVKFGYYFDPNVSSGGGNQTMKMLTAQPNSNPSTLAWLTVSETPLVQVNRPGSRSHRSAIICGTGGTAAQQPLYGFISSQGGEFNHYGIGLNFGAESHPSVDLANAARSINHFPFVVNQVNPTVFPDTKAFAPIQPRATPPFQKAPTVSLPPAPK